MRSLEQIKKDDYENLTYGELCEYDLNCDYCPLKDEFCSGGVVCYGNMPLEPPCCWFDDDTILSEVYDNYLTGRHKQEQYEEEKEQKLKLKKQKSEERKKKLREYKRRNWKELIKISVLKKKIKGEQNYIKSINGMRTFAEAINITNKMFKDANQPNNVKDIDTETYNEEIKIHKDKIIEYNKHILEIKQQIKEKEKSYKKEARQ